MTKQKTAQGVGPDFSNVGRPVEWGDAVPLDERFPAAIAAAYAHLGVDIELCQWSGDDVLAEHYVTWWNGQRSAIRRHVTATPAPHGTRLVVSRRTDKSDGIVKCYVRLDRKRGALQAVAS